MYTINVIFILSLLMLLWAVLCLPFVLVFYWLAKRMRRRGWTTKTVAITYGALAGLMLAPVPTPIITIFMPSILFLFDHYPEGVLRDMWHQVWLWYVLSFTITPMLSAIISLRFFAKPQALVASANQ